MSRASSCRLRTRSAGFICASAPALKVSEIRWYFKFDLELLSSGVSRFHSIILDILLTSELRGNFGRFDLKSEVIRRPIPFSNSSRNLNECSIGTAELSTTTSIYVSCECPSDVAYFFMVFSHLFQTSGDCDDNCESRFSLRNSSHAWIGYIRMLVRCKHPMQIVLRFEVRIQCTISHLNSMVLYFNVDIRYDGIFW